ncbi:phage tail protein [Candidatus Thiodictyon syntrophicum]|jgi:microcystin-dependent protein|uniref:Phage tail protein n=1 Tax=Candidatus Thiodictyon syntrophicum TaxID=1166950 RepID=A0A2K8U4C3_9GAMM|nr:tail fiber protein [Candidatus Thiodictyon syntrophicum]AUB80432.1 phage tail protein [Candidatus Thiodictyon syntrophicum]
MSDPFIAEIRIFAGNFAPRGWALCNGQILPIAPNTALFSLLGTTYGGDGRTNFALPNLQGRAPMHPGTGPGLTARDLGETGGVETVTLTAAELAGHAHAMQGVPSANQANPDSGHGLGNAPMYQTPGALVPLAAPAVGQTGSGTPSPHNNMQPNLAMNFIIALTGIFPPRS